jgi:hypothetical protein
MGYTKTNNLNNEYLRQKLNNPATRWRRDEYRDNGY